MPTAQTAAPSQRSQSGHETTTKLSSCSVSESSSSSGVCARHTGVDAVVVDVVATLAAARGAW